MRQDAPLLFLSVLYNVNSSPWTDGGKADDHSQVPLLLCTLSILISSIDRC